MTGSSGAERRLYLDETLDGKQFFDLAWRKDWTCSRLLALVLDEGGFRGSGRKNGC